MTWLRKRCEVSYHKHVLFFRDKTCPECVASMRRNAQRELVEERRRATRNRLQGLIDDSLEKAERAKDPVERSQHLVAADKALNLLDRWRRPGASLEGLP